MLNFLKQGGLEVQHLKHRQVRKGYENSQHLQNFAKPTVFVENFAVQNFAGHANFALRKFAGHFAA